MILDKYRDAIDSVDELVRTRVLRMLNLRNHRTRPLSTLLHDAGMGQADVVLCLLRIDTRTSLRYVSSIVGRPVQCCPPQLAQIRRLTMALPLPAAGDDRQVRRLAVAFVIPGRRLLPNTPLYDRLELVRTGLTIRQLLARGVTRRDLRIATKRGWIETIEEAA